MLADQDFLFLDCQTTGPTPEKGNLLEIAWLVAKANGGASDVSSYLVQQPDGNPPPSRIQALTGICPDDMQNAVSKEQVRESLQQSLSKLAWPRACLIHYARFEEPFLRNLFALESPDALPFDIVCTHEIARRLFPNLPSKGIRAVAGYFGTTCDELKRARCHAEATLSIWKGLIDNLNEVGIDAIDRIHSWLKESPRPKRTKFEYPLNRAKRLELPDQPGVYRMLSKDQTILYVGKATSLKNRVNSYFRGQTGKDSKTKELLSQVWDISFTACSTPLEAALLETDEIKRLDPPYNRALKRRQRALVFYSLDFSSSSPTQDEQHPLGPFANARVLEPLIKLDASLRNNSFLCDIFYHELPIVLLTEGFALFCINEGIDRLEIKDARSLLALGLWLYRRVQQAAANEDDLTDSEESGGRDEAIADSASAKANDHDSEVVGPEEISAKFQRVLIRMARLYLRSKILTRLLHAKVRFVQNDLDRTLTVSHGKIESNPGEEPEATPTPWRNLDISTYDRMSVLLTELSKLDPLRRLGSLVSSA